jgi:aspartyl-tRNA(Asn)/glutamyl-tRNA(Gln) amidotransferase subunit C
MEREEVRRIAELARLEIPEAGLERTAGELSAILDFMGMLRKLDLAGCVPTTFAPGEASLRADEIDGRRLTTEQALAAAPEAEGGYFLVPPIVENLSP